jgi:type IX secretion system PorP/SprF family membrane protein
MNYLKFKHTLIMRTYLKVISLVLFTQVIFAQQDPMFTKYMFNSLTFNPAYAGSNDHMTINLLHRTQWWGIDGAPVTQTLTLHTPLKNERVGVGFTITNDKIGNTNTVSATADYAYRIPIGAGKLSIGLKGGIWNWRSDPTKLTIFDPTDDAFRNNQTLWLPNFGVGLYYSTKKFYTGLGAPRLIEYDLRKDATTAINAKLYRHYFFTIGGAIPLKGDALIFKPSALIKNVGIDKSFSKDAFYQAVGAPTEFNIDLSLFFQQTLWVGASYRSALQKTASSWDSADLWVSYFLPNGLRIGAAYDYTLTSALQSKAQGSFEIMLGYEFDYKTKRVVTPRYF